MLWKPETQSTFVVFRSISVEVVVVVNAAANADAEIKAAQKTVAETRQKMVIQQFQIVARIVELMTSQLKERTEEMIETIEEIIKQVPLTSTGASPPVPQSTKAALLQIAGQILIPGKDFGITVNEIHTSTIKMLGKVFRTT